MANPQKENGYTAIANEIIDALIASNLSGQEFKISLLIIRKTYGFHKTEDAVSLTQMMAATGISKIRCSQVVNRLQLMKILTVTENINGIGKKYKFNKDFETWNTVNENINRYRKPKPTVNVLRSEPLMSTLTTKERSTKERSKERGEKEKRKRFSPPSISEIYSYCQERKNQVDANKFFDFYEAKNWMIGRNKMKDWKAAIRTWESRENIYTGGNSNYEYRNTYKRDRDNGITAETDRIIDEINREYRAAKDAAASQTGTVAK